MGIKLASLKGTTKKVEVTWQDETAEVTYNPSALTPALAEEIGDGSDVTSLVSLMSQVLVAWELEGEDGKNLPTDAETLRNLPMSFIGEVFRQVSEDMSPGKAQPS